MPLALTAAFADLPDPRIETANKLHKLTDILVTATCAVIAGADGWEGIAGYGRSKEDFFRRFLELPNGAPSHDAFERALAKLGPDAFADRFGRWMAALCESAGLVHAAIDGKSARRSQKDTFTGCLHLVSARAAEDRLILGRRSVPAGGHEITAAPDLLAAPGLRGAAVTLGAAGCQKATAARVREQGGDCVACVKGNQKGLRDAVADVFGRAGDAGFAGCGAASRMGAGHGREGERYATVVQGPDGLPGGWKDVGAAAPVCRGRRAKGGPSESGARYYPAGLRRGAEGLAGSIRNHWGIENGPRRAPGVSFREGGSRARAGHAAANLGAPRRAAASLLKRTKTKGGIRTRRKKAGWGDDYLLRALHGITAE